MNTYSKTLFISDLHLQEDQTEITSIFLKFLHHINRESVDAIYILGDLFEAWIGDDDNTHFHSSIIQALKSLTQQGLPIYFLCGNRDFLIGKRFLHASGCQLLADETIIKIYGHAILLMHGDTLCTKDLAYLKARKILRQPFLQKLFLMLPLAWRKNIAENMRKKSMQHTSQAHSDMMDVVQVEVEKVLEKYDVNYLIHGHTHKPGVHEFLIHNTPATRIVLGAWHEKGQALVWDSNNHKELIEFI